MVSGKAPSARPTGSSAALTPASASMLRVVASHRTALYRLDVIHSANRAHKLTTALACSTIAPSGYTRHGAHEIRTRIVDARMGRLGFVVEPGVY